MTDQGPTSDRYCYRCGSDDLRGLDIEVETGVVGPDGGRERRLVLVIRCRECGAEEEE